MLTAKEPEAAVQELRVCTPDGTELLSRRLDPLRGYWIGRESSCEIVVDDHTVSRRHAFLFNAAGHWYMSDCGSLSGLDSAAGCLRCVRMTPECHVQIGGAVFWLMGGSAEPPEWIDARPESLGGGLVRLGNERLSDRPQRVSPEILVVSDSTGVVHLCADLSSLLAEHGPGAARMTIGRSNAMDLEICHPSVDPLHCVLARGTEHWSLVDAGSTCGIDYDGKRWFRKRLERGVTLPVGDFRIALHAVATAMPPELPAEPLAKRAEMKALPAPKRPSVFLGERKPRD